MKTFFKIIFLFLIFTVNANAQPVTWSKWFDYNNSDNSGQDVIQTFDGGYLVLGINYISLNYSSILIKTNKLGEVEWQKVIDQTATGGEQVQCYALQQSKDSGFVLSGYARFSDSAILLKTNKDGSIRWIKKYSRPGMEARFFDHKITLDGGIIACGDLFPPFRGFVIKTDENGNKEWDSSYSSIINEILQSPDSNYYILSINSISKISNCGKIIWTSGLGNIGSSMIQQNPREIYTLYTGNGLDSMLLNKIDSSGNLLWKKSYFPVTRSFSLCFSKEGNILLAGYKDTLKQFDIVAAKVSLNGNLIYRKRLHTFLGNLFMYPQAVKATNDYGFIFTGPTDFPGIPYQDNIFALKTDSLCNASLFTGINISSTKFPEDFQLLQNYPNPFNPSTTIDYELPNAGSVKIIVYDISGKEVKTLINEFRQAGSYNVIFDGKNLASGVYFYKLVVSGANLIGSNNFVQTRRMVLIK